MPRQIEVQSEGEWKLWNEAHPLPDIPWRYVGGVLEMESGFGDWIPMLQHYASIEEARAAVGQPHLRIRLRPYDDAEDIATVYARELPGLIQAERQKQHAGRRVYGLTAGGNYVLLTGSPEPPIPALQRPADASVAPAGDPRPLYGPVDWRALYGHATRHANELSDTCGTLRTENDILLRENAKLRREEEAMTKSGGTGVTAGRWLVRDRMGFYVCSMPEGYGGQTTLCAGEKYARRWTTDEVEKLFSLTSPYSNPLTAAPA